MKRYQIILVGLHVSRLKSEALSTGVIDPGPANRKVFRCFRNWGGERGLVLLGAETDF